MGAGAVVFVVILCLLAVVAIAQHDWVSKQWHKLDPKTNTTQPVPNGSPASFLPAPPVNVSPLMSVRVAEWTLDAWGPTQAADDALLQQMLGVLDDYDVVVLVNLQDPNFLGIKRLCDHLPSFRCRISHPSGPLPSQEVYVVVWRPDHVGLADWVDFAPDDRWDHPPIKLTLQSPLNNNASLLVYVLHTDPGNVYAELNSLDQSLNPVGHPILVVGDLNADCAYYAKAVQPTFVGWNWQPLVPTTTTAPCTYDRILANADALPHLSDITVRQDDTSAISTHKVVETTYTFPLP